MRRHPERLFRWTLDDTADGRKEMPVNFLSRPVERLHDFVRNASPPDFSGFRPLGSRIELEWLNEGLVKIALAYHAILRHFRAILFMSAPGLDDRSRSE